MKSHVNPIYIAYIAYISYIRPSSGLTCEGCWFLYYLHVFHSAEHQTGAVLPRSFRAVLYLDPYGWAKHTRQWWNRVPLLEPCVHLGKKHLFDRLDYYLYSYYMEF